MRRATTTTTPATTSVSVPSRGAAAKRAGSNRSLATSAVKAAVGINEMPSLTVRGRARLVLREAVHVDAEGLVGDRRREDQRGQEALLCEARREAVLVESAGGLLVPLARNVLSADFASERGWPLILVTCGRLGAINHTLLSLEAAATRHIPLAGVVYNDFPETAAPLADDAKAAIMERLAAAGRPRAFAEIPVFNPAGPFPDVDFTEIFQ